MLRSNSKSLWNHVVRVVQKKRKGCSSSFALGRKKAGAFDCADEIRTPVASYHVMGQPSLDVSHSVVS